MKKKSEIYSNQPGVRHAVSEFDNPRNKPIMGKGPAAKSGRGGVAPVDTEERPVKAVPRFKAAKAPRKAPKKDMPPLLAKIRATRPPK